MSIWLAFSILMIVLLIIDFGVFERSKKALTHKQAWAHSAFWIVLALLFNGLVYAVLGGEKALQFFTGYLIEKSLSIDNLFVFLLIFLHFHISEAHQKKILFWGILGALIFRMGLISAGVALIQRFHWTFYLFGVFLIYTGGRFAFRGERKWDPEKSGSYRFFKAIFPMTRSHSGEFLVKRGGKWKVTKLFLVLLLIESADILFAFDSIPAVFAVTTDTFIIYTSNVFAVLGLRSLYFVIASSMSKWRYFEYGFAGILIFVGIKMVLANVVSISLPVSLAVIFVILSVTALLSIRKYRY